MHSGRINRALSSGQLKATNITYANFPPPQPRRRPVTYIIPHGMSFDCPSPLLPPPLTDLGYRANAVNHLFAPIVIIIFTFFLLLIIGFAKRYYLRAPTLQRRRWLICPPQSYKTGTAYTPRRWTVYRQHNRRNRERWKNNSGRWRENANATHWGFSGVKLPITGSFPGRRRIWIYDTIRLKRLPVFPTPSFR